MNDTDNSTALPPSEQCALKSFSFTLEDSFDLDDFIKSTWKKARWEGRKTWIWAAHPKTGFHHIKLKNNMDLVTQKDNIYYFLERPFFPDPSLPIGKIFFREYTDQ